MWIAIVFCHISYFILGRRSFSRKTYLFSATATSENINIKNMIDISNGVPNVDFIIEINSIDLKQILDTISKYVLS